MRIFIFFLAAFLTLQAEAFELVAHRGVHQQFSREGLTSNTCTATRMLTPTHDFLENTVTSMEEAFRRGATMVEVDVHPTQENDPARNRLVVFHDWALDCRTEARCDNGCRCNSKNECVTHEQSWDYLRTLDIGFGYTTDDKTYPFRGQFKGAMPTLADAMQLLVNHPQRKLLIDVKDHLPATQELLLKELASYPVDIRRRVLVEFAPAYAERFRALEIQTPISTDGATRKCLLRYLLWGSVNAFPKECANQKILIPLHENLGLIHPWLKRVKAADLIWGWPEKFIKLSHRHGSQVYVSQINTPEDLEFSERYPFDGIVTDRIEVIGPLVDPRSE